LKKISVVFVLLFFCSCQYFEKQVPNEKELLKKQLEEINWDKIDQYPSVTFCDSVTNDILKKQCFFEFLSTTIKQKLNTDTPFKFLYPKIDSITIKVTVLPDATVQFEPQFPADSLTDVTKRDSIFQSKLLDFPPINPGKKRGIPVKTQFILPFKIKDK
jgi:hypothetical protein